ncbi:MAG: hypothetical protein SGBAC_010159 [Bacillariaceae sp.]
MSYFQRSLDWCEKRRGEHTLTLARTLSLVGRMNIHQEQYDTAMEYFQSALDACSSVGFEHMYIAGIIHANMGWARKLQGGLLRKSYEAAMEIYQNNYGPNHHALGSAYTGLGEIWTLKGD